MPKSKPNDNNSGVRIQPERTRRGKPDRTAESVLAAGEDGLSHLPEASLGSDFSQATFEHHAALLADPRMSRTMYTSQRIAIVMRLQRDYGNRYVQRLVKHISKMQANAVQTKLTVGPAGDKYEQEADQVAKQVMGNISSSGPETAQRQGEEEELQMQPLVRRQEEEEELQMQPLVQRQVGLEGGSVDPGVEQSIHRAEGRGQPLPVNLRRSMEGAFGADFSGVKVHTGAQSDSLNESMSSRAFTTGSDIFLRQGEYNPGSAGGKELLAHELTHVVQQGGAGALDLSRLFESGSAIQRIVVTIGTEKVEVDEADGEITEKGEEEKEEAEKIIKNIKDTYGIDISSPKLVEGIKDQYTNVPKEVTDTLETREWKMIELRSIAKALASFAPILGKARADSTRKGEEQEVTAFGKAKNAIDQNKPAGKLDVTTLGEFFKGKKVMGTFKSSEGATPDFPDEGDQLVGTFVHETAHGLLSYAYDDFVKASDGYWTDLDTKSGKDGAEAPPTGYGKKNAREDMCETAMLYFVDKSRLSGFPKRLAFMEKLGTSWVPPVAVAKKSGCFITTACVEAQGLPDNCEELNTLRAFRDGYMSTRSHGPALISEYYEIAPRIVDKIKEQKNPNELFSGLYENLVLRSVSLIKSGKNDEALQNYAAVVRELKNKYL